MSTIMVYLHAHPLVWAVLGVFLVIMVLRLVAKIACVGVLILIALTIATYFVGLYGGYA